MIKLTPKEIRSVVRNLVGDIHPKHLTRVNNPAENLDTLCEVIVLLTRDVDVLRKLSEAENKEAKEIGKAANKFIKDLTGK